MSWFSDIVSYFGTGSNILKEATDRNKNEKDRRKFKIIGLIYASIPIIIGLGLFFAFKYAGGSGQITVTFTLNNLTSLETPGPVPESVSTPIIADKNKEDFSALLTAAYHKDSDAQFQIGQMMLNSSEYSKDEACHWLEEAVEQEHPDAVRSLANQYIYGNYIQPDEKKVVSLFEKAAALHRDGAYFAKWLGWYYDKGILLPQDPEKALYWYKQAAKDEDSFAQYRLGVLMMDDNSPEHDPKEAITWLEKAVEQDQESAVMFLANLYIHGEYKPAAEKLIGLFEKAAAQPNDGAYFARWLGWLYDNGGTLKKNINTAFSWYKRSAKGGDSFSQYRLGVLMLDKKGPEYDPEKAVKWLEDSAEQNDTNALYYMAERYLYGDHEKIPQDTQKALELYKKCVDLGDADVADWLSKLYSNGWFNVDKNKDEADKWAQEAARIREQNAGK